MEWKRPIQRVEVLETDPLREVISLLKGNVFHVTLEKNLAPILGAKAIFTNENGDRQSAFGNFSNSFLEKGLVFHCSTGACLKILKFQNFVNAVGLCRPQQKALQ